jgi:ubiquinone/menaquinone biosynthesis C-methylase UbiE
MKLFKIRLFKKHPVNSSVIKNYSEGKENKRAENCGKGGMEFIFTEKIMNEYIRTDSVVGEIGCGTGHYAFRFANKCREYKGYDLTPANVKIFQDKIKESDLSNVSADIADATNLINISDSTFDVVMVLGPMYHLDFNNRLLAFKEAKRICKDGGIVAFAYINKAGASIAAIVNEAFKGKYPTKECNQTVLQKGTDDKKTNVFFFSMPEEMISCATECGFEIVENRGLDFVLTPDKIKAMPAEQYEAWLELIQFMSESPSCTGMSGHALLICRKV